MSPGVGDGRHAWSIRLVWPGLETAPRSRPCTRANGCRKWSAEIISRYKTRLAKGDERPRGGKPLRSERSPQFTHLTTVATMAIKAPAASATARGLPAYAATTPATKSNIHAICHRPECGMYANGFASVR